MSSFLDDVRRYVGLDDEDEALLRTLGPLLAPHLPAIADNFYVRLLEHPSAHTAITGGAEQVARLERTLVAWMDSGLRGPYDESFYERRARIGRRHVDIGLPQQYMVTAIGVVRQDYHAVLANELGDDPKRLRGCVRAIDRLLDVELAIMLQSYRIDSDEKLRRGERLAAIGLVAATIAHDLRNPLGVIESSAYILRRLVTEERGHRHIERIEGQVRNSGRIVTALLELARSRPPKFALTDLRAMANAALGHLVVPEEIDVEVEIRTNVVIEADAALLEQVVVNLVVNAIAALVPGAGRIVVAAGRHDDLHATLSVSDDGPGFDPELLPRVFEPLVTSRTNGVGLGLALVKSVAERHHGVAIARNGAQGGASVQLLLPWRAPTTDVHA